MIHAQQRRCRRGVRVDPGVGREVARRQRGSGVESEPAEPQQAGTEHHERDVVAAHLLPRPAAAFAEDERHGQACGTGVDVDDGSSGEVFGEELSGRLQGLVQPAVAVEHPVRDGGVDDDRPHRDESRERAELPPVGGRAGDQGWSDDRECHLEGDEREGGGRLRATERGDDVIGMLHAEEVQVADELALPAEGQGKADQDPGEAHDRDGREVLDQHAEDVFGSHHAAVEEGETRSHQ